MNSLNFCLSVKDFISSSFLRDNFVGHNILGWQFFFPFSTLNMSYHSLPVCQVSAEKYTDSLIEIPLYVTWHSSLVAFRIFSVFDFWQFDYNVPQRESFWVESSWRPLGLLNLDVHISYYIWEVFSYYFIKLVFCDFLHLFSSDISIMWIFVHWMVSHKYHRVSSFLFILAFFLSDWVTLK